MRKYIFINTAVFKGKSVPLYKVFDTETRETSWVVYSISKRRQEVEEFAFKADALRWRQIIGSRK